MRKGSKDRALFLVISGKVLGISGFESYVKAQSRANEVFITGSILGCQNMVFDEAWEKDLICQSDETIVAKFDFDSYKKLKETQSITAVKLYNRFIRNMTFELIYDKKNEAKDYLSDSVGNTMDKMKITDKDLIIDLKIGNNKELIQNIFTANRENVTTSNQAKREQKENLGRATLNRTETYGNVG